MARLLAPPGSASDRRHERQPGPGELSASVRPRRRL